MTLLFQMTGELPVKGGPARLEDGRGGRGREERASYRLLALLTKGSKRE